MKYVQKEQGLYIIMDASVYQQLAIQAESEYPNENGGMLAGCYSDDRKTVYIKQLVTPAAKKTDCTSFVREATGMDAFWSDLAKEGLQYVGEWHSHPNGSTEYSLTDYEAMTEIEHEVKIALSLQREFVQGYFLPLLCEGGTNFQRTIQEFC